MPEINSLLPNADSTAPMQLKLSEVIAAMSYALDITEGQPKGHAARSCMLGMRMARELQIDGVQSSALFYALLLKDLGCSSNADKMCYLFGSDDRAVKHDVKTVNWTNFASSMKYALSHVASGGSIGSKIKHFSRVAIGGPKKARELIALRCDRGARIARQLEFPEQTADAIASLDEHWDGGGHPMGRAGKEIPLLARILCLSQTVEVFLREQGHAAAMSMAKARSGTWFDPKLVKVLLSFKNDKAFWETIQSEQPAKFAASFEPQDAPLLADEGALDRIAEGFSQVIDAKSPWTYKHSTGVAYYSAGIATVLGFKPQDVRYIRRAALVHDVGKLGISNMILDKPGKLTPEELTEMRRHTGFTYDILYQVNGFRSLANLAASHHEQLDGKGYHRGLTAEQLDTPARILAVADVFEALTAKRPYRQDLTSEEVSQIMARKLGTALCPNVYAALQTFVAAAEKGPERVAA